MKWMDAISRLRRSAERLICRAERLRAPLEAGREKALREET
jgi:hypothetical protein